MNRSIAHLSESIVAISTLALIGLFPLFFLPFTANYFETNKLLLVVIVAGLNLIAWVTNMIALGKIRLTLTPITIPALAIGLVSILSAFITAPSSLESFANGGILVPALALILFSVTNLVDSKKFVTQALYVLIGSSTILSILSVLQSLGFGLSSLLNQLLGTNIPGTLAFTPAGSPVALISLLAPTLILTLFMAFTKTDSLEKITLFLLSAINTAALVLLVVFSFPGKETSPIFLPVNVGYNIALDTLKSTRTLFLGYGPGFFMNAYNELRPASINVTPYWNVRFTNSSNEVFQTITTTGIIGFLAWILLTVAILRVTRIDVKSVQGRIIKVVTIGMLLLQILLPFSFTMTALFYFLLMMLSVLLKKSGHPSVKQINADLNSIAVVRGDNNRETSSIAILPYLIALPVLAIVGLAFYYTGKVYAGEVIFKQAVDAAAENDGIKTYNLQQQAITMNPWSARFRRAYSATNLALANSIAGKEQVTDEDRANITTLIQQSIREGKNAVTLDPQNTSNWENLVLIYRSLIGAAQSADQWTIATLIQAIQSDKVNPRLRLELGGVYYSLGRFDQAARFFQQSAELKPDWANAYYNLAHAYEQQKNLVPAYENLQQTLSLVAKDSADYTKAAQELQVLADKLNLKTDAQGQAAPADSDLQTASPAPSPAASPLPLPGDAGPGELAPEENPPQPQENQ